jgi:hypothetical protein
MSEISIHLCMIYMVIFEVKTLSSILQPPGAAAYIHLLKTGTGSDLHWSIFILLILHLLGQTVLCYLPCLENWCGLYFNSKVKNLCIGRDCGIHL